MWPGIFSCVIFSSLVASWVHVSWSSIPHSPLLTQETLAGWLVLVNPIRIGHISWVGKLFEAQGSCAGESCSHFCEPLSCCCSQFGGWESRDLCIWTLDWDSGLTDVPLNFKTSLSREGHIKAGNETELRSLLFELVNSWLKFDIFVNYHLCLWSPSRE